MIPLINVIFLITIFIVMMINFSEVLIKKVALPKADEAKERKDDFKQTIQLTAQSSDTLFLGMTRVGFDDLEHLIRQKVTQPERCTVQFRGEENIPYDTVQKILLKIAAVGISRVEFSATREPVPPLEKDLKNETSD